MQNIETVILLMALLTAMYSLADKLRVSYPILLVITGLLIGFVPGLPLIQLKPEIVFMVFLPPLLYSAACHISWHEFKRFRRTISMLAIGLVLCTTLGVAVFAHAFIPGFDWPSSFILGAIVSPSDAVAATTALKGMGLPRRILTILEGESLVNDASALITYRFAVIALTTGNFVLWHTSVQFFVVGGGGILCGLLIGYLFTLIHRHIMSNSTAEVSVTFLVPFISFFIAENMHVSGILSVVTTGLLVSWRSYELFSFHMRMKMNNFWDVVSFLLNGMVFMLMGLQLPNVLSQSGSYDITSLIHYGLVVSGIVVLLRIIWVLPVSYFQVLFRPRRRMRRGKNIRKRNARIVMAWAGMRGVVSLATALALPYTMADGAEFTQRGAILFITFVVILITLVFQGLTLPLLASFLNVRESVRKMLDEEKSLRLLTANSSVDFIDRSLAHKVHKRVHSELREKFSRKVNTLRSIEDSQLSERNRDIAHHEMFQQYLQAELAVSHHQREFIIQLHKEGSFSEEVLRKIEQELDIWNLSLHEKIKAVSNLTTEPRS